jgi:hypothetical protein
MKLTLLSIQQAAFSSCTVLYHHQLHQVLRYFHHSGGISVTPALSPTLLVETTGLCLHAFAYSGLGV